MKIINKINDYSERSLSSELICVFGRLIQKLTFTYPKEDVVLSRVNHQKYQELKYQEEVELEYLMDETSVGHLR